MFTESGLGMACGITLCLMALISLVIGIRQYFQKGSLFSITAFFAEDEVAEKLKTKKIYRGVAWGYIVLGCLILLLGLSFVFDQEDFAYVAAVVAIGQMCVGFMRFFFGEK